MRREILLSKKVPVKIEYVQNTNGVPIEFVLSDFTIPASASAFAYVKKPSGLEVFSQAEIDGNVVIINPTTQMMAEIGYNKLQVLITAGGNVAASFVVILDVEENITEDSAVESQNEYSALESLITQANETISAVTAATQAANSAASSANTAAGQANTAASSANNVAEEVENKLDNGDFAATVSIGNVTTGEPGTNASVTNSGTENDAVFDFTIPRGDPGSIENVEEQPVTFTEASARENITSGDDFATLFGKIQKFFSDTSPLLEDSGWQAINTTGKYQGVSAHMPQCRKIGNMVEVSGAIRNTTNQIAGSTTEVTLGTLPSSDYYPSKMVVGSGTTAAENICQIRVNTNGTITASRASEPGSAGYTSIPANTAIFFHEVFLVD